MKTVPPSQKRDTNMGLHPSEGVQGVLFTYPHETNITEGGEFLDDAIRTEDDTVDKKDVTGNDKP